MQKGGGDKNNPTLLVSDLHISKFKSRQGHRLPCTMKPRPCSGPPSPLLLSTSFTVRNRSGFSSVSLSLARDACLHASVNSRPPPPSFPSYSYIFLFGLASLMSESFHLTKSLLVRVSLVSLNLCQDLFHMSKHFNDIWCWDLGEGASLRQEEDKKQYG